MYLRLALRALFKSKLHVAFNLLGLTVGFGTFLALYFFTAYEESFDYQYTNPEDIVRIKATRINADGSSREMAYAPYAAGPDIKAAFPEVQSEVHMARAVILLYYNNRWTKTDKAVFASEDFFNVFTNLLIQGDQEQVLDGPNNLVVSESFSKKVFGEENPMGKMVNYKGRANLVVTGVFRDFPENSHIRFDALMSFKYYESRARPDVLQEPWRWDLLFTYLRLIPGTSVKDLEEKLPRLVQEKTGAYLTQVNQKLALALQSVTSIHLTSHADSEFEANGDGQMVFYLKAIAVGIMVLVWINYICMTTAGALERTKEVGVRKVLGSNRRQLMALFLTETLMLAGLSLIICCGLLLVMQPVFPDLILDFEKLGALPWPVTVYPVAVLLAGSLFAGLYPAWELSRLELRNAITGHSSGPRLNFRVRNVLVFVQFAGSLLMVTWMYVVFTQVNHVRSIPLGFEQDAQLVIRDSEVYDSLYDARTRQFAQELKRIPGVKQTTSTATLPGERSLWYSSNVKPLSNLSRDPLTLDFTLVDMDFVETYGLTSVAGPGMSETSIPWKTICLNTRAVKALGFSSAEEAIDQQILFFNDTARIVSVVEDFYFFSPREGIHPLAFLYAPDRGIYFVVHTEPSKMAEVNRQAESLFKQIYPGQPYSSESLTDYYNQQYKADASFEKTLTVFTALSVCITCLGLIAMATFISQVRRKEIGIRKTLGATSGNVVYMLLRQYIWLMALASAVAVPASWFVCRQWLDQFANRVALTPQLVLLPVLLMLLTVLATVGIQTLRAARTNPMDAIRYE